MLLLAKALHFLHCLSHQPLEVDHNPPPKAGSWIVFVVLFVYHVVFDVSSLCSLSLPLSLRSLLVASFLWLDPLSLAVPFSCVTPRGRLPLFVPVPFFHSHVLPVSLSLSLSFVLVRPGSLWPLRRWNGGRASRSVQPHLRSAPRGYRNSETLT